MAIRTLRRFILLFSDRESRYITETVSTSATQDASVEVAPIASSQIIESVSTATSVTANSSDRSAVATAVVNATDRSIGFVIPDPELDAPIGADNSPVPRGVGLLVELFFETGTIRYTTAPVDITPPLIGETFIGVGGLASVSTISESEDTSGQKLNLEFAIVNSAMLSATLGSVESYRRRRVKVWVQIFNEKFMPIGYPKLRWVGVMNRVVVNRKSSGDLSPQGGSSSGRIVLECIRTGMDRYRNQDGPRLTDSQQKMRFPGDRGLEYISSLIEEPSLWLSKKFQMIK